MSSRNIILFILCFTVLISIHCTVSDISGGSGAETGNARVAGVVVDTCGNPIEAIEVLLYPTEYNPENDTPPGYPIIEKTNASGNFDILSEPGLYSILARSKSKDECAFVSELRIEKGNVLSLPDTKLKKSGSIKLIIPSESELKPGTVYISGTPIKRIIDTIDIIAGFVQLDTIAEYNYPTMHYISKDRNYITVIAEQINVISGSTTIVNMCRCSESGKGYDAHPLTSAETKYVASSGVSIKRYAWAGSNVALLTKISKLNPCVIRRILEVLDTAYRFNARFLGSTPSIDKNYLGLLPVAEMPEKDGVFSGMIGVTGVEIGEDIFDSLYSLVAESNSFHQELFFVLAFNFNNYMNRLTHSSNAKYSTAVSRGFSVFMRFITMEGIGVKAKSHLNLSLQQYREKIEKLMDLYIADSSYNFANSFTVDTLPFADLKSEHLFASMLMRLGKLYGTSFYAVLWNEIQKRPVSSSLQTAIDNLVIASSIAANRNILEQFAIWKIPVSQSATTEITKLFP